MPAAADVQRRCVRRVFRNQLEVADGEALPLCIVKAEVSLRVTAAVMTLMRRKRTADDGCVACRGAPFCKRRTLFDPAAFVVETARMNEERLGSGVASDDKRFTPADAVDMKIVFARLIEFGKV